jgi:hypothetical protein
LEEGKESWEISLHHARKRSHDPSAPLAPELYAAILTDLDPTMAVLPAVILRPISTLL